jgi:hypothetical protein
MISGVYDPRKCKGFCRQSGSEIFGVEWCQLAAKEWCRYISYQTPILARRPRTAGANGYARRLEANMNSLFSNHWRKTGFRAYLIPHANNFVILSRGLAAKAMAWMKVATMSALSPTRRRQGLRKLSPDLISKASDETAAQVARIELTFLGTTAFCFLSLFSPDSALLGGSEKIGVPLAGPVSFSGFMMLGPAVLIMLRVYLQIYVEYRDWLDRLSRRISAVRAPNLVRENWLLRLFSGVIFYLLLPLTMMFFAWKAAVFPLWGLGLLCVALGVIVSHAILWLNRFRRLWPLPLKVLTSVWVVFVVLSFISSFVTPNLHPPGMRGPFILDHANLSGQWLAGDDLRGADLTSANLSNAELFGANLNGANLYGANLNDANLNGANLRDANLSLAKLSNAHLNGAHLNDANLSDAFLFGVNLIDADLSGADLTGANLSFANLSGAKNLTQMQLDGACGDTNTKLPEGLSIKPCPE